MARYLVIRDGEVVNATVWDGLPGWSPPEGCIAVLDDKAAGQIGMLYDEKSGTYSSKPDERPPPAIKSPLEKLVDKLIADGKLDASAKEDILATE